MLTYRNLPDVTAQAIETVDSPGDLPYVGVSEGAIRYAKSNDTTYTYNGSSWSPIGGVPPSLDIGDTINGSTYGSILYVGVGGVLAQDTNLAWSDSSGQLAVTGRVRITSPVSEPTLELKSAGSGEFIRAYDGVVTNYYRFFTPASLASNVVWEYPTTQGAADTLLSNDGSGTLTWVPTQWTTSGLNIYYNTGSVGIGTTSPTQALEIVGTVLSSGGYRFADATTQTTAAIPLAIGASIGSSTSGRVLFVGASNELQQDSGGRLFWDNSSNYLGVGTSTPAGTLDVVGNANISDGLVVKTSAANNQITVNGQGFGSTGILFNTSSNPGQRNWLIATEYDTLGGMSFLRSTSPGGGASTNTMTLSVDGNVGIGTTTPLRGLLQVGGTSSSTYLGYQYAFGVDSVVKSTVNSTYMYGVVVNPTFDDNGHTGNIHTGMAVDVTADVSFRAANFSSSGSSIGIQINGTAGKGLYVNQTAGTGIYVNNASGPSLVTATGSVGIGIAAPTEKFQVKDGHYGSKQTTAPTIAVDPTNTGTGATIILTSGATDTAGNIDFVVGTGTPLAGDQFTITFDTPYATAPILVFSATSSNGALAVGTNNLFATTTTTTAVFSVGGPLIAGANYTWSYICIGAE